MSVDVIRNGLLNFLPPDEFAEQHPGVAPEKYVIFYQCKGLADFGFGLSTVSAHAMEIVCGWEYPSTPPTFIWLTPIWHPNFRGPYVCIYGRPFAPGLRLADVVQEVGRMVQYQIYDPDDALNADAGRWARANAHLFPIDDRDLLDSRRVMRPATPLASDGTHLIEVMQPAGGEPSESTPLLEVLGLEPEQTLGGQHTEFHPGGLVALKQQAKDDDGGDSE
jgi:hypothetical protein